MAKTKGKGLLYFDSDRKLFTQECLPAKVIVEAIANHSGFILGNITSTKQQHFNKHKIKRRLSGRICTVVGTEVPQKAFQDEHLVLSVVGTIKTEEKSSLSTSTI